MQIISAYNLLHASPGFPFQISDGETLKLVKVTGSKVFTSSKVIDTSHIIKVNSKEYTNEIIRYIKNTFVNASRVSKDDSGLYATVQGVRIPVKFDIMPWADSYGQPV
jgi:hypothetical protein